MTETASPDINQRIAGRVRDLRSARGQSLETLAQRSGVSRSMISLIERGESSATAVVLEKLAAASGCRSPRCSRIPRRRSAPVARRTTQPEWRDPASGYLRRNVSPAGVASPLQLVEVEFPPGARVAYESGVREVPIHQQVWVLEGSIEVSVGDEQLRLARRRLPGMVLDRPIAYRNPDGRPPATSWRSRPTRRSRRDEPRDHDPLVQVRRPGRPKPRIVPALAHVLIDCVAGGASVSFMHPLARERAEAFWRGVIEGVPRAASGSCSSPRTAPARSCGTVQVVLTCPRTSRTAARSSS